MDDPSLPADRHRRALAALARINRVSGAAPRLLAEVARVHGERGGTVRVLDVACGGGDVLHLVARAARRRGIPVELHGCDRSPRALELAARGPVTVHRLDALLDTLPGPFEIVTTNLFLHHLDRPGAVSLLQRMADRALEVLLVQDLRRTRLGYGLAWLGLHTLTGSDVARTDGLRSVRSAFTVGEVERLCADAGLAAASVTTAWPQRFVVRWLPRSGPTRARGAAA
jgi:2-polyprenyl-3-methyl-5-hydroxy-6-metoxy-1,4-benzoquinol methylase